eukprot:TRINITY_DN47609_c0_g1_i1.p1 TRINITY_DN47609_c0_g1~~TRINITY_DN47609_c0_g1_i1.p1  ORF type:complete len:252 (+),score=40.38 TRINITY_DN47609_c0_g1_i1:37-756(+)
MTDVVKACVFDFDNTLLLSEACKKRTLSEVCQKYDGGLEVLAGVHTDSRTAPPGVTVTRYTIFKSVAEGLIARGSVPGETDSEAFGARLCDTFSTLLEERLPQAEEVAGATAMLQHLQKAGVPCYVNTATPLEPILRLIDLLGWRGYFREIFGAPATKLDNLVAAATCHELSPAQVVHVGDGDNDCRAARDFGCAFVGVVLPDGHNEFTGPCRAVVSDMHGACRVICDLAQIGLPQDAN